MRIKVFDPRLYKDDISTPLSVTLKDAVVVKHYWDAGDELVNVIFDYDGFLSKGHFVWSIKLFAPVTQW